MTSLLIAVVFGVAFPEDEYLGKLVCRAQVDKRYDWKDYTKDKKEYQRLDEQDRMAVLYASRLRSNQARFTGTPAMRIEQTSPVAPLPRPNVTYPPIYRAPAQYPYYYPYYSPYSYNFWIH